MVVIRIMDVKLVCNTCGCMETNEIVSECMLCGSELMKVESSYHTGIGEQYKLEFVSKQ